MTETIRDVYSRITGRIIVDLEKNVRPWMKPWNAEHAAGTITRPLRHNGIPYKGITMCRCRLSRVSATPKVTPPRSRMNVCTGTKHEKRLARDFGRVRFGDEGYAKEELVAELGSAFLCADLEITPEVREDNAAYIASWLKALKDDRRRRTPAWSGPQLAWRMAAAGSRACGRKAAGIRAGPMSESG